MGGGAAVLGASTLALGACGGGASKLTGSKSATQVRRGGTLRAAITGGSSSDTLDAQAAVNNADFARLAQLYETLFLYNADARLEPVLAEEITPNADATEWTIRLRPGVTFHNGKPFTAEDVIFSLQRILSPKTPLAGANLLAPINLRALTKVDPLTVNVPCTTPFATLPSALANTDNYIVPTGYNPKAPVGTGPFKFKSFSPGVQSTFVRYDNYWMHGLPYLDSVVITDYADQTSQVNALISGAADVVNLLSQSVTSEVTSGGAKLVYSPGGGFTPFTMRVDTPPFNDVRVRQAMRLIVDRPQMLDLVFGGHGALGNDVFSIWDPEYDQALPQRSQDLPQARSLLKAAGHDNLRVNLVTSNIAQGTILMAQVFQQQAKSAGVTVSLQQLDVNEFYGPNYLKWPFAQDFWYYSPYLVQVSEATLPGAPFNECHFDNPTYNSLYNKALAATSHAAQTDAAQEMQRIDYDQGGYIIPFFSPVIDGYVDRVHGVVPSKVGVSFNDYDFRRFWLSA